MYHVFGSFRYPSLSYLAVVGLLVLPFTVVSFGFLKNLANDDDPALYVVSVPPATLLWLWDWFVLFSEGIASYMWLVD